MLNPTPGKVIVKAYLRTKAMADDVLKRSGLHIATAHDKKHSFEGVPNQGFIYALPSKYSGPLKVGQRVVFDEASPQGFKWQGDVLFTLKLEQIAAIIEESE